MKILLKIFVAILNIIYLPIKLFKTKNNKVIFLSRQSNTVTLDFMMIAEELKKQDLNIDIVFLCKRFDNIKLHLLSYGIYNLKVMYHIATSKVCVVDSYSIVSMLKNKKDLKVLQIWHALGAIKKFSYQTVGTKFGRSEAIASALRMHYGYDAIISTSSTTTEYFMEAFNYEKEKFLNYGLPRIDYLLKNNENLKNKIIKKYPELSKKEVILYAPTFRKEGKDKTDELIKNIDFKKYNLIVKGHINQTLEFNHNNVYTCDDFSALDLLCVCDYLITDYSAIAIEAAVLDKKTYYYVYDYEKYQVDNGLNVDLYKEMPGCVFKNAKKLIEELEKNMYNMSLIESYKQKYIENLNGNSTKLISELILEWSRQYENKEGIS